MPFDFSSFVSYASDAGRYLSQCIGLEAPADVAAAERVAAANLRWDQYVSTVPAKPPSAEGRYVHFADEARLDEALDFLHRFAGDAQGRIWTASENDLQGALTHVAEAIPPKFWFEENPALAHPTFSHVADAVTNLNADLGHL
ncbi:hypothetical protein [Rhodoligotrophos defluvii]|uniref:hypothetical protein n=1 Tax=Rhodoligotrophos defluvii TaxID=2561934 RepID=UPI0010C9728C|nr:hypothetical protein [Rhodoligotrophos defluvii]